MRRPRLGTALALALAVAAWPLGSPAAAADAWRVGGLLGAGWGQASAPADGSAGPTLLEGSAFSGVTLRGGALLTWAPIAALHMGAEAALVYQHTEGYAARERYRRELSFAMWSLDILPMARAPLRLGGDTWGVEVGAGVGWRLGLRTAAVERRIGFASEEPALPLRVGHDLLVALDVGVVPAFAAWDLPLRVRYLALPSYGRSTADRLESGRYRAGVNWQLLLQLELRR